DDHLSSKAIARSPVPPRRGPLTKSAKALFVPQSRVDSQAFEVLAEVAPAFSHELLSKVLPGQRVVARPLDGGDVDPVVHVQASEDVLWVGRDSMATDRLRAVARGTEQLEVVGVVDVPVDRRADVVDLGSGATAGLAKTLVSVKD